MRHIIAPDDILVARQPVLCRLLWWQRKQWTNRKTRRERFDSKQVSADVKEV